MKTKLFLLLLGLFLVNILAAQSKFSGGEISVKQTGTYSVAVFVDLYTTVNSDLQSIELCWGDGLCEDIPLFYSEELPGTNFKFNQFQSGHVYGGENTYTLTVEDCCWGQNIINITQANLENIILSTSYFHSVNDPLFGENHMPYFSKGMLHGYTYLPIFYNSEFTDPEGDEIQVEVCDIEYLSTYNQITEVYPTSENNLTVNATDGSFQWISPQFPGTYVLGLCVSESRNGMIISEYTRNILIVVDNPVGNQEIFNDSNISVFPNPANDQLTIKMPNIQLDIEVDVFDAIGNIVLKSDSENVDISSLETGVYFLIIKSGDQLFSEKVVKL